MAIIPLRAYNREIEGMIDNGQLDEAVAHCRHILATFPKYLASYRLLGKAHLEQQRISDAIDIFQRVLSAIPDDFIANVGMSIIREDENNLDASIWHMELAYEAQPANIAIQDELRRLYGRRDGMQPPKVRLTRGALARMYAKGGLFDQAIAELRAAISEDPNRADLQLLLAQMFYQTSQRVEAVDTCVSILKKIPFCLEANRILAVSLPEAEGSDAVKNYRQMVISMDPYYAFAEPDAISSEQVPENAVNIERLEWKSGIQIPETPAQPNWATSLGISMETPTEEKVPDWLKSSEAPAPASADENASPGVSPFIWDTQEVKNIITDTSKPEGEIPDWMKDAGWQPASGEAVEASDEIKSEEPFEKPITEVPASEDLEKAEIPEWLAGIAPEGILGEETEAAQPKEEDHSIPWLDQHQPGPTDSIIHWLEEKKPEAPITPRAQQENITAFPEDEMPDWLKGLDLQPTSSTQAEKPAESSPALSSETPAFLEEPVELAPLGSKATPFEETLEQGVEMQPAQAEPPLTSDTSGSEESAALLAEEVPDWLKDITVEQTGAEGLVPSEDGSAAETPPITESELVPEQPVISEEAPAVELPVTAEEVPAEGLPVNTEEFPASELPKTVEEIPATEIPAIIEKQPAVEVPSTSEEVPAAEQPISTEELPAVELPIPAEELPVAEVPSISEEVQTAKQPISNEELPAVEISAPVEGLPIAEVPSIIKEIPAAETPAVTEELLAAEAPSISEEVPTAEQPISTIELPAFELPAPAEEVPAAEIPPILEEQPQIEQPLPGEGELTSTAAESMSESDAFAWLEGLAAQQGVKEEELTTPLEEREVLPPDWEKLEAETSQEGFIEQEPKVEEKASPVPAEEIPEWIKGLGETTEAEPVSEISAPEEPALEEPAPEVPAKPEIPQADELPAWLLELEQPELEKEEPVPSEEALEWKSDELPAWLKEITETAPTEEAPAAEEVPAAEEISPVSVEPASEWTDEIVPTAEAAEEVPEGPVQETATWVPEVELPVQPVAAIPVEPESAPIPVTEKLVSKAADIAATTPPEAPVVSVEPLTEVNHITLTNARNAVNQGLPTQAAEFYTGLIKQNYHLDEIIKDLQDALYRFPVDTDMWVSLGDAYFRTDKIQESLNAYTKAEELVR